MKKIVYYLSADKACVQDFYVDIILNAFQKKGYAFQVLSNMNEIKKLPRDSYLVLISSYAVFYCRLMGFRNIFYWSQGVSPEESFMRNKSYLRKFVSSIIELYALKRSRFCFLVSSGMLIHYKNKYKYDLTSKSYVMPCYNSEINREHFHVNDKYVTNKFCYVGGLSVWQCFLETVQFYKKIEQIIPSSEFVVLTPDEEEATSILMQEGVKNYSVKFVHQDQLLNEIKQCKFGFIIRHDSPVNYVATPTKLSNYLASGIIPIVTNSVKYFSDILSNTKYNVILDNLEEIDRVIDLMSYEINAEDVFIEYKDIFNKYFNSKQHINNIATIIEQYID